LTDDNALEISYEAETDKPTVVNLLSIRISIFQGIFQKQF
jgi:aldose 1-epimerase